MNKYLIDLASAFQKVSVENYCWNALNNDNGYEQEAENNFSSEIVRHFRNQMEKQENKIYYKGLFCHFDVRKARVHLQPDIVLHESPENQQRQEFYCEVKVNSGANLENDLRKLSIAISEELKFKFAVMIVANKDLSETQNEINKFVKNQHIENLEKLYLFHGIPKENETICFTIESFDNIINRTRLS